MVSEMEKDKIVETIKCNKCSKPLEAIGNEFYECKTCKSIDFIDDPILYKRKGTQSKLQSVMSNYFDTIIEIQNQQIEALIASRERMIRYRNALFTIKDRCKKCSYILTNELPNLNWCSYFEIPTREVSLKLCPKPKIAGKENG
jgi:phage FluMu protein Com